MPRTRKPIPDLDKRLKKIFADVLDVMNPAEAARELRLPERTLRTWLDGKSTPGSAELLPFAVAGINLHWLLTGEGSMMLAAERPAVTVVSSRPLPEGVERDLFAVPILADASGAGNPQAIRDDAIEGWGVIHTRWCPPQHELAAVFVPISGDSMKPTIPDGSLVLVDTAATDLDSLLGHPVLIRTDDGLITARRLFRAIDGQWAGIPDNPTLDNPPICIEDVDGNKVIGRIRSVHAEVK